MRYRPGKNWSISANRVVLRFQRRAKLAQPAAPTSAPVRALDAPPIAAPSSPTSPIIPARQARMRAPARSLSPVAVVQWFVLFQLACQIALLFPALGPLRVLFRSAAFGASLLLLLTLRGRQHSHPASWPALCILAIMGFSLFHPACNTVFASLAQVALYAAILAPIFWVGRTHLDGASFRRIILTFWAFHTLSATVGVLQVYFPGELQPSLSTVLEAKGDDYVDSLRITLPNGQSVFRPMGLTDQPGGAATAGLYAVLFGLGLILSEKRLFMHGAALGGMAVGFVCLYLSQVRSVLVMAAICIVTFCFMLLRRGDFVRFGRTVVLLGVVIVGSFLWAVSLGGDAVTGRLATLIEDRADDVYYDNRGHFLDDTIHHDLPMYPCGAGLGRWGMMNQYFGDNSNPRTQTIWVEIQWTGWVLDGGIPLVLAYVTALGFAFWVAWKIAVDRHAGDIGLWAALILAYNLAAFAVTFNYPLFIGQGGLEFWLLNACLYGVYRTHKLANPKPTDQQPRKLMQQLRSSRNAPPAEAVPV